MVLAHGHVFRHVPSGLPQKPHRGSVHGEAQAGSHKAAFACYWLDTINRRRAF
jgi:hypothetical protein